MKMRTPIAVLLSAAAFAALAQQLYRWTDEKGRVHITDTPPPASARNVQRNTRTSKRPGPPPRPQRGRFAAGLRAEPGGAQFPGDALHRAVLHGVLRRGARIAQQARRAVHG